MSFETRVDVYQGSNSLRMLLIAEHNRLTEIIRSASQSLLNKPPLEQGLFAWVNHGITILNLGKDLQRLPVAAIQLQAQITILAGSTLERIALTEQWTDEQIYTLYQFHQAAEKCYYTDIFGPLFIQLVENRNSAVRDYQMLWDIHVQFFSPNCLNTFLTCFSKPFTAVYSNACISASEKALLSGDLFEAILIKEQLDVLPPINEQDLNTLELRMNAWSASRLKCDSFDIIEGFLKARVHLAKWEHFAKKDIGEITKQSLFDFIASFHQDPQFKILNDSINQIRMDLFNRLEIRDWMETFKKAQNTIRESFPKLISGETRPTTGYNQPNFATFYESIPHSKDKEALNEARNSHLVALSELNQFLVKYRSLERKPASTITEKDLTVLEKCKGGIYELAMTNAIAKLRGNVESAKNAEFIYRSQDELAKTRQNLSLLNQAIRACKTKKEASELQTKFNAIDAKVTHLKKVIAFADMRKELNATRKQIDALIETHS